MHFLDFIIDNSEKEVSEMDLFELLDLCTDGFCSLPHDEITMFDELSICLLHTERFIKKLMRDAKRHAKVSRSEVKRQENYMLEVMRMSEGHTIEECFYYLLQKERETGRRIAGGFVVDLYFISSAHKPSKLGMCDKLSNFLETVGLSKIKEYLNVD